MVLPPFVLLVMKGEPPGYISVCTWICITKAVVPRGYAAPPERCPVMDTRVKIPLRNQWRLKCPVTCNLRPTLGLGDTVNLNTKRDRWQFQGNCFVAAR